MEREFQIHRTEHDYSLAEFWKWTLALLIGIVMGILGFLVDWGIEKLNNFKFDSTISSIKNGGKAIRDTYMLSLCCITARPFPKFLRTNFNLLL